MYTANSEYVPEWRFYLFQHTTSSLFTVSCVCCLGDRCKAQVDAYSRYMTEFIFQETLAFKVKLFRNDKKASQQSSSGFTEQKGEEVWSTALERE